MESLITYLSQLNASERWGLYVDPTDYSYRFGDMCYEDGGGYDGKICVGSLQELSFGFQSESDAFGEAASAAMGETEFDRGGLYEAFAEGRLPDGLQQKIQDNLDLITSTQARDQAEYFVLEELPVIFDAAQQSEVA